MISLTTAAPAVGAAFVASLVEVVEAFTIVLAAGTLRGWRGAVAGTAAGLAALEQHDVEQRLELGDTLRDRGLRNTRLPGRAADAPKPCHGLKYTQVPQIRQLTHLGLPRP